MNGFRLNVGGINRKSNIRSDLIIDSSLYLCRAEVTVL